MFSRATLEEYQFTPLKDLEKNNRSGLLRLTDQRSPAQSEDAERLKSFEKAILAYFLSRNEDSLKHSLPAMNTAKFKSNASDVVRPSNTLPAHLRTSWTTDVHRTPSESRDYTSLHHTRSGLSVNEQQSISSNTSPDFYYHQSAYDTFSQGHHLPRPELHRPYTHSADDNRNAHSAAPLNEISF